METINLNNIHNNEQNQTVIFSDNIWDQIEKTQETVLQRFSNDSLAQTCAIRGLEKIAEDIPLEPVSAVISSKYSTFWVFQITPEVDLSVPVTTINLHLHNFDPKRGETVTVYKYLDTSGNIQIKLHKETFEFFGEFIELVDKIENEIPRRFPNSNSIARTNAMKQLSEILNTEWPFREKIKEIKNAFPFL